MNQRFKTQIYKKERRIKCRRILGEDEEKGFGSLFCLQCEAEQSDVVRQSQKVKRLTFYEQNNLHLGASSEFCVARVNPWLSARTSSIRRIGITCYTSLDFYQSSTFYFCFLWHTKSSGYFETWFLYSPYFGKHGLLYSIFRVSGLLYLAKKRRKVWRIQKNIRAQLGHILKRFEAKDKNM